MKLDHCESIATGSHDSSLEKKAFAKDGADTQTCKKGLKTKSLGEILK
jgi:hypothetical protein